MRRKVEISETRRLSHVNCFSLNAMKEGIPNKFTNRPFVCDSIRENKRIVA